MIEYLQMVQRMQMQAIECRVEQRRRFAQTIQPKRRMAYLRHLIVTLL